MSSRLAQVRSRRRGANAVEFALVLPVLLALTLGGMDWGWYFWCGSALGRAVRDGARAGATAPAASASTDAMTAATDTWKSSGIGGNPVFSSEIRDVNGVQMFTFRGQLRYTSLVGGLVPMPASVERASDMHRP